MVTANDMGTIAATTQRAKDAKSGGSGKIADPNAAPKGPEGEDPLMPASLTPEAAPGAADLMGTQTKGGADPSTRERLNKIAGLFGNYGGMV